MPRRRLALFAAGSNSHGQLGTGSDDDAHTFRQCTLNAVFDENKDNSEVTGQLHDSLPRVKIAAGANHTLLLVIYSDSRQELYYAGSSQKGQLGKIYQEPHHVFRLCHLDTLIFELSEEDLLVLEERSPAQDWQIVEVAAGWEVSLILLASKSDPSISVLLSMGSNDFGQLGDPSFKSDRPHIVPACLDHHLVAIHSGPRHCVAVTRQGRFVAWGTARHGQLDLPALPAIDRPTSSQSYHQQTLSLGNQHTCVIDSTSRTVHLLGSNRKGQLGSPDPNIRRQQLRPDELKLDESSELQCYTTWTSTFLLSTSASGQTLYSFGNNAHGQLGRPCEEQGTIGTLAVGGRAARQRIEQMEAGSEHVLCLLQDQDDPEQQEVWAWGWNEHGNLGTGSYKLEDIHEPRAIWWSRKDGRRVLSVHAGNGTSWIVAVEKQ